MWADSLADTVFRWQNTARESMAISWKVTGECFNANFNADCKCRVVAVSNTFLYDETAYLGSRGIMPFNAQINKNGKISRIKGTFIADNPGQNKKMETFKIKNDADIQVCTGTLYYGKGKLKGQIYLSCFNNKVTGNFRKLSIQALTSGLFGTVSKRNHEPYEDKKLTKCERLFF